MMCPWQQRGHAAAQLEGLGMLPQCARREDTQQRNGWASRMNNIAEEASAAAAAAAV
jgi:hypothetical protein